MGGGLTNWACVLMVLAWAGTAACAVDCSTVNTLISGCSGYILSGAPLPYQGTLCCNSVTSLNNLADTTSNRQAVCRCIVGLISSYHPNATAIASLPGLCGIDLGFTIDPNIDCNGIH